MEKEKKKSMALWLTRAVFLAVFLSITISLWDSTSEFKVSYRDVPRDGALNLEDRHIIVVENGNCFDLDNSRVCYNTFEYLGHDTKIPLSVVVENPEPNKGEFYYIEKVLSENY